MNRTIKLYLVFLAGGLLLAGSAGAAEGWWNKTWDYRIPLVLQEKQGIERRGEPVVIPGLKLSRAIGQRGLRLSALRLVADGRELPLQIDEKDGTGAFLFQNAGNDLLDDDDDLVFQVTLKPHETKHLYLYGNTTNAVRRARYETGLEIRQNLEADRNFDIALVNQRLTVGIRSGRNSGVMGGLGKGAVTWFQFDGSDRVTQGYSWGMFLFGSQLQELPWGEPVPLSYGPVRAIVAVKAMAAEQQKIGGKPVQGEVIRYFMLYDGVPYFVFREKIPAKFTAAPFALNFNMPLQPCGVPRDWVRERLYAPDAKGKVTVLDYKSEMYQVPAGGPGWLAFHNPERGTGLALLFPPGLVKSGRAHVCDRGTPHMAEAMKSAYGANTTPVTAAFALEPDVVNGADYAWALLGLDRETPEELAARLTAWKTPLGNEVEIQPLEVQP